MTTKRNRRAWAIGLSVFAALLVIGVIANAFGAPTAATKTDPAGAIPSAVPVAESCQQQVAAWRGSAGSSASAQHCFPLSDEGTCYEPGEYCRDSDQGVAGIAGDGQTIVCADNDGLRWEPTG